MRLDLSLVLPLAALHGSAFGAALPSSPSWSLTGMGVREVASGGDLNGDGVEDFAAGAPYVGVTGLIYVWLGGPGLPAASPPITLSDTDAFSDYLGEALSISGDLNGDGFDDLVASDMGWGAGSNLGRISVWFGGPAGPAGSPDWQYNPLLPASSNFGGALAIGDFDGDGYDDLALGAYGWDVGGFDQAGAVMVFPGSATGPASTPTLLREGSADFDQLGSALDTCDIDGDGYPDLVVSVPGADQGGTQNIGQIVVFPGSSTGLNSGSFDAIWGPAQGAVPGTWRRGLTCPGDVDGDGLADVLLGRRNFSDGEGSEGAAYLYPGTAQGLSASSSLLWQSDTAGASAAIGMSGGGDVDGDGFADWVTGGPYANGDAGSVFVIRGGGAPLSTYWSHAGSVSDQEHGYANWLAGDVDGNGYDDLFVVDNNGTARDLHLFLACLDSDNDGSPDDPDCVFPPLGDDDDSGDDDDTTGDDDDSGDDDDTTGDDDDSTGDDDDTAGDDDDATGDDDDATGDDDDATGDDDDDTSRPFEGDEPGECDDGADNDQDGLFDCEDDGCANAPVCETGLQGQGCCAESGSLDGSWLFLVLASSLTLVGARRRREALDRDAF